MDLPTPLLAILFRAVKQLHLLRQHINARREPVLVPHTATLQVDGDEDVVIESRVNRKDLDGFKKLVSRLPPPCRPFTCLC
jgi:hypothetical protein